MTDQRKAVDTRLVIGPNASLTGRQALVFFAVLCAVTLGIAGTFAALGFWPVLPFAGLELVAVGAALVTVLRRNGYREVLEFSGERLRIETGMVGAGVQSTCDWPRGLTRVWLERGAHATSPTRLVLAYGAARATVGQCLTDPERAALAARLKQLLHPAWERAGASPDQQRHSAA